MKVLLVEDSQTVRAYVESILRPAHDVELLPPARDGATGVAYAIEHRPDVILMDLELPVLSGLDAISQIMAVAPRPIVVLSAHLDRAGEDRTFESFQAGAVDVLAKPRGLSEEERKRFGERLLSIVRVMSQARVLRRPAPAVKMERTSNPGLTKNLGRRYEAVLIGTSTGGPVVLRALLDALPAPYPLPIAICQHIVPGFEEGLARWLGESRHRVAVAREGDRLAPGVVLLSRADKHLVLRGRDVTLLQGQAASSGPPRSSRRGGSRDSVPPGVRATPSADLLFESAAKTIGASCVALLLTGMGEDGKRGLSALRSAGALTVTQTADTCVIDGMPGAARAAGAGVMDLSPPQMIDLLHRVVNLQPPRVLPRFDPLNVFIDKR